MKLLSRLFKKTPPKVATIEDQIKALATQSELEIITLATHSGDDNLREAAIGKLAYGTELLQLATQAQTTRIQTAARKRICQLLDEKSISLAQLTTDIPKQIELMAVVSYSAAASTQLLGEITSPTLLLQLANEATTTQIRQAAAAQLTEREHLEQLAKTAQTKDKNVFKLVKSKLDVFKAQDAQVAEIIATAETICTKLEKQARLDADPLFKVKVQALQQEWANLTDTLPSAVQDRYTAALGVCEAKIAEHADAIARAEEKITLDQQALDFAKAAIADIKTLTRDLFNITTLDESLAAQFSHRLQELTQAMRLAANRDLPMDALIKEFEQRKQSALNLIDQIKSSGTLQQLTDQLRNIENSDAAQQAQHKLNQLIKYAKDLGDEIPEAIEQAKAVLHNWQEQRKNLEAAAKNNIREFSELTRKGLWAAEQGFVRKARGIQKELAEKQQQISNLPKALQAKLEDFEQQLVKLGDWHEFAVTPKKEALITQMQSLINSKIAPEDLATKIHDLQDSWKEVSKGGQQQDDDLWQQFQQASDQAYIPCKQFFEEQAAARESNLTKRRDMVTQLQTYINAYDWQNAVWKDVEKTLKVARQEWQHYWPVPRKAGNELQKEFESLMEQLFGKITTEYETNKQIKQELADKAKTLLDNSDINAAIESVKQLQAQWKTIGKSWYKEDQQLWQEFRTHCDAVFARRAQHIESLNQARAAIQAQAESLIAKLNGFCTLELAELTAAKADIEAIKTEFFALELPRENAKKLSADFNNGLTAIADKLHAERNKAEEQSWVDMFTAANSLRQFELATIKGKATADDKAQLETSIQNIPRWPTGSLAIIQQRLNQAEKITAADQTANTEALRTLTIRAEILAGRETPETDKAARMAYQVQQMQQAFGQRDSQFTPLIMEWIAIAGVDSPTYDELLTRFNACRAQGTKK